MRTIIIGASVLGRSLAAILVKEKQNVAVIDLDAERLNRLKRRLDILTVTGNGAAIQTLKKAGIHDAQQLIAVSDDDAVNLLACRIAQRFNVPNAVCHLHSMDFFSPEDGITTENLGEAKIIVPEDETVLKIVDSLANPYVIERIRFSNPLAGMTAIKILEDSPICGIPLRMLPDPERFRSIRFAAIIRKRELIVPHGDSIIHPGDEVYLAGHRDHVEEVVDFLTPLHTQIKQVVIAGGRDLSYKLSSALLKAGYHIKIIEKNEDDAEELLNMAERKLSVILGDPTESDILTEAGVDVAGAFIAAMDDDEDNILCGILAKRHGSRKVIVVTNKAEYIEVVPEIERIDASFNTCLIAINSVLQALPQSDSAHIAVGAILQRTNAYIYEIRILPNAPVINSKLSECSVPGSILFALIFRNNEIIVPNGDTTLAAGDTLVSIATPESIKSVYPQFKPKTSILSAFLP